MTPHCLVEEGRKKETFSDEGQAKSMETEGRRKHAADERWSHEQFRDRYRAVKEGKSAKIWSVKRRQSESQNMSSERLVKLNKWRREDATELFRLHLLLNDQIMVDRRL